MSSLNQDSHVSSNDYDDFLSAIFNSPDYDGYFDFSDIVRITEAKCKSDVVTRISRWIAQIDRLISEQLDEVLHSDKFQKLEAAWYGLQRLTEASANSKKVKVRFLDISWREVTRDIERSPDFDQSALFELVYNREFGIAGGEPIGILLGNYDVTHRPTADHPHDDINTLKGIAQVAAAAFCPFICSVKPELFGLDSYDELGAHIRLSELFLEKEYTRWQSLRDMEDSRFIGLALPRILMRTPHEDYQFPKAKLHYNECVDGPDSSKYLWGNAVFALGVVLIREFIDVGWFAHIRGAPRDSLSGGLVIDFPKQYQRTDSGDHMPLMTTSTLITDTLEHELSELGLIPLCHCMHTGFSSFHSIPSIQKPKIYTKKSATANARISSLLQQMLCASRFAQYIKIIIRDKIGSYKSAKDCERHLQQWLNGYSTGREDLPWESLARYPLREARVSVMDDPRSPGNYQSIIHLKTHYTVDHLVSELKLTTTLNIGGSREAL
ncbi:type VI secretion system contractile sheath large subunit [Sessilibacter corallicola]|uniref:type VI secretion system contractile sheath large subunit n=1 Tax=Sessilibacter corallicola TaxID=2904075 RepID=UPI001E48837A|nr:type VI secretion system contractile sheath large subunit [Sessilibacter corallicola]MCE2026691.1 type VI secretion system contractile sheath large subunit [Sessilibacter corallicola]